MKWKLFTKDVSIVLAMLAVVWLLTACQTTGTAATESRLAADAAGRPEG